MHDPGDQRLIDSQTRNLCDQLFATTTTNSFIKYGQLTAENTLLVSQRFFHEHNVDLK